MESNLLFLCVCNVVCMCVLSFISLYFIIKSGQMREQIKKYKKDEGELFE